MRMLRIIALAVLVAGAVGVGAPLTAPGARAQETITTAYFYDKLSPYGQWVNHSRWGWVWYPTKVASGWRPYLHGRWIRTDEYGWYWQSDEDWGWAVYHYGRWTYDSQYGWIWIPGTVWGPGWVAWRTGNAYVGWAPLPPGVGYDPDDGLLWGGVDLLDAAYDIFWVFVPGRLFLGHHLDRYAYPRSRNRYLLGATRNATRYGRRNGRIVNRGPAPTTITRRFGRRVPTMRVRRVKRPRLRGIRRGNVVNVFRPRVRRSAVARPPTRLRRAPPRTRGQRRVTPRRTQPRRVTPRRTQPRRVTPRRTHPRRVQPRTQPRRAQPRRTQPRRVQPRRVQPRRAQPRRTQPRRVQPRTQRR
jgi:hypothetical protein